MRERKRKVVVVKAFPFRVLNSSCSLHNIRILYETRVMFQVSLAKGMAVHRVGNIYCSCTKVYTCTISLCCI